MASKLCPHIQVLDGKTLDAISQLQPPMVKTMDLDRHTLQAIRSAAPNTLIVGRRFVNTQDYADPLQTGTTYANSYQDVLDLLNVVEVYNEAISSSTAKADQELFDTFQGVFAYRIWDMNPNVRVGLFCLPTGNFGFAGEPKLADFPKAMALPKNKVFICLHEYSWFTWDWQSPARCLRYRQQMAGLSGYQVLITECGMTQGVVTGRPDLGWRSGVPRNAFVEGAKWYDSELMKDSYIVGAAMFTCGTSFGWDTFECTAEWVEAATGAPPSEPAPPKPQPQETLEQYVRRVSWDKVGVNYNPDAAFVRYARQNGLGKPESQEFDVMYASQAYRIQAYTLAIVLCPVGQWDMVRHISW
jgi:hypothetical protein